MHFTVLYSLDLKSSLSVSFGLAYFGLQCKCICPRCTKSVLGLSHYEFKYIAETWILMYMYN
jgi:hypothetical protein